MSSVVEQIALYQRKVEKYAKSKETDKVRGGRREAALVGTVACFPMAGLLASVQAALCSGQQYQKLTGILCNFLQINCVL